MPIESAIVAMIPEADNLLEAFRKRHDHTATGGLPAHVTILYPFLSPDDITTEILSTLRDLFLQIPSFTATFPEVDQFPDALYLMPVPAEPFRQLTEMVVHHFPDAKPYGGAFTEIIPHLTMAVTSDADQLKRMAADFRLASKDRLPLHAKVNSVILMDNSSGDWKIREVFPLGANDRAD